MFIGEKMSGSLSLSHNDEQWDSTLALHWEWTACPHAHGSVQFGAQPCQVICRSSPSDLTWLLKWSRSLPSGPILLRYAESPGLGFHLIRGLLRPRMHICPSINKGICVRVFVCGYLGKQYLIPTTCHSPSACPAPEADIPALLIYLPPATETWLDNYLLSLTGGDIIRLSSTQNILLPLKCSLT